MPRPRNEIPALRYHLTLERPIAARLAAHAKATGQSLARAAAVLITDALTPAERDETEARRDARRQSEELTGRVQALRRQPARHTDRDTVQVVASRWEWPMDALLADAEWWDRWLPRLNELMGRVPAHVL